MSQLGGFKAVRTKAKKDVIKLRDVLQQVLQQRPNLPAVPPNDLAPLETVVGDLHLKLVDRLNKLDIATESINKCCIANKDQKGQDDLHRELDEEDDEMMHFKDAIISLRRHHAAIQQRLNHLQQPKAPPPAVKIEPDQGYVECMNRITAVLEHL